MGVLLVLVMMDVRLVVLFTYQSNDQFSAIQAAFEGEGAAKDTAIQGFWVSILILAGLIVADIVRTVLDTYLMQRFIIRWRVWLTERLTGDWLDGDAYYKGRFIDDPIDNADQRIQQDIDIFTTGTGPETNTPNVGTAQTLAFGTVFAIVNRGRVSLRFCGISPARLTLFGITVPKALFWMAFVYVFLTTVVAFWIGRPLIRLSFRNELTNAAFRYALVRLRDAGEAIGLYRGAACRAKPADDQVLGHHHQLPGIRPPWCRLPRLEQVDEPDRRPTADDRSGSTGVRRPDSIRRRHTVRRAPSVRSRARCRSSVRSTTRSPVTALPSFASTGSSPPTKQQGRYRH